MPLASVSSSLTTLVGDHGLYAVFGLMAIDAVFPAASELVMLYAGALAAGVFASHVTLFGSRIPFGFDAYLAMALAGAVGYLIGALVGWAIGLYGGRPLLERRGRLLHLSEGRLARAERWFDRWDDWAVLLGRVTPVARSFVSIPAGIFRMPLPRYTALTAIGSAAWCFAFAGAGWGLGRSYERFHRDFRFVDYAVVAAAILLAGWLLYRWRASRRARLAAE